MEFKSNKDPLVSLTYVIMDELNVSKNADHSQFWSTAKRNYKLLHGNRNKHMQYFHYTIAAQAHFFDDLVKHTPDQQVTTSLLSFSNIGKCNYLNDVNCNYVNDMNCNYMNSDGNEVVVKTTACFHGTGGFAFGPALDNFITTTNNRLFWGVQYTEPVIERDIVERYANRVKHLLVHYCGK